MDNAHQQLVMVDISMPVYIVFHNLSVVKGIGSVFEKSYLAFYIQSLVSVFVGMCKKVDPAAPLCRKINM